MLPTRILIVGGGGIGERHLRVFANIPGVEVSLCEPRTVRASELQRLYPVKSLFSDFFSLDPSLFNAIVLCTPANLHVPMATHAATQGCPFLMEKPLSTSLDGTDELISLVKVKNLIAGVAYVFRSTAPYIDMKRAIEAGRVGAVRTLTCEGGQYFPAIRPDHKHNYFARHETGGGVLLDFMSHVVNLAEWLNGRETELSCFNDRLQLEDIETDDVGFITMRFENGSIGHLQQDAFRRDHFFHVTVVGSKGTLLLEHERGRLGYFPEEGTGWQWTEYNRDRDEAFTAQAFSFLKALEGKAPIHCTLEEAQWTLRVILAARQSANQKRHVRLDG